MRATILILTTATAICALAGGAERKEMKPLDFDADKDAPWLAERLKKCGADDKLVAAVVKKLKEARGNWPEVAAALKDARVDELRDLCEMLRRLPPLYVIEATGPVLFEHLREARAARALVGWKLSDADFYDHVLDAHILYEPFRPWRRALRVRLDGLRKESALETARAVDKWVAGNVRKLERAEMSRYGWWKTPLDVLRTRCGSRGEVFGFCIGLLRTLGVPARLHRGGWVEFKNGDEWLPLYPFKPENFAKKEASDAARRAYAEPGSVRITFTRRGHPMAGYKRFNIMRVGERGYFETAYYPDPPLGKDGVLDTKLPAGEYRLVAGLRNRNGDAYLLHRRFKVESGKKVEFAVELAIPLEAWDERDWCVRPAPEVKGVTLDKRGGGKVAFAEFVKSGCSLVVFFRLDNEPTARMMPEMLKFGAGGKVRAGGFLMVHIGDSTEALEKFVKEHPGVPVALVSEKTAREVFRIPFSRRAGRFHRLPSVMLWRDGRLLYWSDGFEPDVARLLAGALERK